MDKGADTFSYSNNIFIPSTVIHENGHPKMDKNLS